MKKFLMAIVLCLVCTLSFGEQWDNLGQYTSINDVYMVSGDDRIRTEVNYTLNKNYVTLTKYKDFVRCYIDTTVIIDYDMVWEDGKQCIVPIYSKHYEVFQTKILEEIKIPNVVYDEYNKGCNLLKFGNVSIAVGLPCLIAGAACSFSKNYNTAKAGTILLGIGGFTTSVGISLDIWGSHLKHSANRNYELYNLLKYNNDI